MDKIKKNKTKNYKESTEGPLQRQKLDNSSNLR